jgi:hypothetical protein
MAILIAMAMQRYNTGRIARWSTSGASLEATEMPPSVECLRGIGGHHGQRIQIKHSKH